MWKDLKFKSKTFQLSLNSNKRLFINLLFPKRQFEGLHPLVNRKQYKAILK